jgi:hypothetical protein
MTEYTYVGKFFFNLDTYGLLIITVHKHLSICLTSNYRDSLANSPHITLLRVREAQQLNIEVSHTLSVGLDEPFARRNLIAH